MRAWFAVAALNGFIAVAAGAFAAHALQSRLDTHGLQVFETGARYQMYHALAIGLAAFVMREQATAPAQIAAALFLVGIVLFSGSLYLLALTGTRALAIVTPFGGVAFLLGWLSLAWAGLRVTR